MLRNSLSLSFFLYCISICQAEPVQVGVILPLSGPAAGYSKGCVNAIELAKKDFNSKIADRFSIVFEDDQNTPAKTISALKKLAAQQKAQIFLTWSSNTSLAVSSSADREGFIQFALATDPRIPMAKRNVFNYWVSPEAEIKRLLTELKARNIKRVAILTGQQEALISYKKFFSLSASEFGVEIVFDEEVNTDTKDFKTLLSRIKGIEGVDGIFDNLYVDQTGILARQARELGIKVPLFAVELFEDPAVLDVARGALEGQFYVTGSDGQREFVMRYRQAFPDEPLISSSNCYDFVGLLANAPELSIAGIRTYLETLKSYDGASGIVSASGDHRFSLPAIAKQISGREFVPLPER